MTQRCRCWFFAALASVAMLVLLPSRASAQVIAGTVTDATGGVLPGVTVEAASPALIEKVRVATTNEAGKYSIIGLRPGVYTVTFTLTGFNVIKRDDILLTNDFSAPVNAQLSVGTQSEVVDVRATPLVDVENLAKAQAITSEMLDTVPLASRNIADIVGKLVVGAAPPAFGVGISYRGNFDLALSVDGNRTVYLNSFFVAGTTPPLNAGVYSEYSFTSGVDNIDSGQGGVRLNVVPKDGGNTFAGSVFGLFAGEGWNSDNIAAKYHQAPFVTAAAPNGFILPASIKKQFDINPSFGGPILKNRIWYQNTFRATRDDIYILNGFEDSNPDPLMYTADLTKRVSSETHSYSGGTRLTWQASQKDKFAGFYDDRRNNIPNSAGFGVSAGTHPDAMGRNVTPHTRNMGIKWSRTASARLLLEGGGSKAKNENFFEPNDTPVGKAWAPRVSMAPGLRIGAGLPIPALSDLAIRDSNTIPKGAQPGQAAQNTNSNISSGFSYTWTANAQATYVTGSHTLKAGMTFLRGDQISQERLVGDTALNFTYPAGGGAPVPLSVLRYIPRDQIDKVDADWGIYVQDQWSLKRLTLKGGVRLDALRTSFPNQRQAVSAWLPEQTCATNTDFCGKKGVSWNDISPRVSAGYDLFGNGKTAIKAGLARYVNGDRLGLTFARDPIGAISRFVTTTWTDLNLDNNIISPDGTYQLAELAPVAAGSTFGTPVLPTRYDPDILDGWFKRGFTWDYEAGIDQQILPRLSSSLLYYHRADGNQRVSDNLNTNNTTFDGPFCLVSPNDPALREMANKQVCGLYDITQAGLTASLAPASNFNTFAKKLGNGKGFTDVSDGFEILLRTNLPRGTFLQGGFDIRSALTDRCNFSETPELRFCRVRTAFNLLPKFAGAYTLPEYDMLGAVKKVVEGIQVSGSYQMTRGPVFNATWTAYSTTGTAGTPQIDDLQKAADAGLATLPASHVPTGLTEVAFSNGTGTTRTKTVTLFQPNSQFLPYIHNVDIRLSKIVSVARYRVTVGFDMYNALNKGSVSAHSTAYGTTAVPNAAYLRPTSIIGPRQYKLSANFAF